MRSKRPYYKITLACQDCGEAFTHFTTRLPSKRQYCDRCLNRRNNEQQNRANERKRLKAALG